MKLDLLKKEDGFTLLEILISFVILSGVMGVVFQIVSSGTKQSVDAYSQAQALVIARSVLDLPVLETGHSNGADEGYEWRRVVIASTPRNDSDYPVKLVDVEVNVRWKNGIGSNQITLSTQKLLEDISEH